MSTPDLKVNGIVVPVQAAEDLQQEYEDIGGFTVLRFADGSALGQESWKRVRTTIVGSGLVPPGLHAVNWRQPVTLACIATESISSASNVITIPSARRTDASPYAFAIDSVGMLVPVSVALAGNVATLGTIAGAAGYQVHWYPLLTVVSSSGVRRQWDANGAVSGWELTAEEV